MSSKSAVKRPQLKAEKRKITGKKVKQLRREGVLPANVYGKGVASLSVQVQLRETKKVFGDQGETGLVDLAVKGEKSPRIVLIKNPQTNPVSDEVIHLEFHQVNLKEKVTANIPIEFKGESPAVKKSEGVLVRGRDDIEVEALPTDLPEKFVIDLSVLKNVDDAVTVADLKIDGKKVDLKVGQDQIIAKIEPPAKEEVTETPEETATEEEGEEVQGETEDKAKKDKTDEKEKQQPQKPDTDEKDKQKK